MKDDEITFNFGKYKGKSVFEVYNTDAKYFDWITDKSDMTRYTKSIFRNVKSYVQKKLNS
jgi:DNA polymerase-3 subunit epsilon